MLHSLQVDFIQEDERGSTEEDELATFSWVPYSFQGISVQIVPHFVSASRA